MTYTPSAYWSGLEATARKLQIVTIDLDELQHEAAKRRQLKLLSRTRRSIREAQVFLDILRSNAAMQDLRR